MGAQTSTFSSGTPPAAADAQNDSSDARSTTDSACPVPAELRSSPIYNVYNERIDQADKQSGCALNPRNNIAYGGNQPFPGQKVLLSTERVQSSIPKGGTDGTWQYPSPQMFYNALKRKGKDDGMPSADSADSTDLSDTMNSVIYSHNTLNEMTWRAIQRWESLHPDTAKEVKLNRFIGRPDDTSPIAFVRKIFGGPSPFDRHDWYLLRDGREVRYVIDFYFDDSKADTPEAAFSIIDRPALDSVENLMDRVKMSVYESCARWDIPCPVTGNPAGQHAEKCA